MKLKAYKNKTISKSHCVLFALFACVLIFHFPFSIFHPTFHSAAAHRFHTSLTRIDYNKEQKNYEITIQLFTHDLVPILEKRSGRRVDLEKTSDVDKLVLDYLNENFGLIDKKGAAKLLNWVGKEVEVETLHVYLETEATENLEGYKLKNTIFLENFPEQTNLVVCRYDDQKADLLFKTGDKIKEIIANKTASEETK